MNTKFLLFKLNRELKCQVINTDKYVVKCFSPKPWSLKIKRKKANIREMVFRFYISLLTFGKVKIYYVENDMGKIIHSSYLIRKNFKYPFLQKQDAVIGPCNTESSYRGKGIYPFVINYIANDNPELNLYMFIREEKVPSINGVRKAGYELCSEYISSTRILKRFYRIKG